MPRGDLNVQNCVEPSFGTRLASAAAEAGGQQTLCPARTKTPLAVCAPLIGIVAATMDATGIAEELS